MGNAKITDSKIRRVIVAIANREIEAPRAIFDEVDAFYCKRSFILPASALRYIKNCINKKYDYFCLKSVYEKLTPETKELFETICKEDTGGELNNIDFFGRVVRMALRDGCDLKKVAEVYVLPEKMVEEMITTYTSYIDWGLLLKKL